MIGFLLCVEAGKYGKRDVVALSSNSYPFYVVGLYCIFLFYSGVLVQL